MHKFFQKLVWLVLVASAACYSCRNEVIVPAAYQEELEYFPLKTGNWIRYQVDSLVHIENDPDPCLDSVQAFRFEVMEVVDTPFVDGEGDLSYRIVRYRRIDSLQSWDFAGLWTAKVVSSAVERVEENIRFIKMSFPLDTRSTWNGNAYNTQPPESYRYEEIGNSYNLNGLFFPSTVLVLQNDFVTSIGATVKWERYAKGVGMVEKYVKDVRLLFGCGTSSVIDDGLEYSMKVIDYEVR